MPHERQYPWDILAIDETDDKKAIKKAYAVLIKQYKPDEHPEKFQEIQEAYQYALNILKWDTQEELKTIHAAEQPKESIQNKFDAEIANEKDDEIANTIYSKTKKLLDDLYLTINDINNWKFIENYFKIHSIQIKQNISDEILKKIAETNLAFQNKYNRFLLDDKTLRYLNSIFDWQSQTNHLLQHFYDDEINAVLTYSDSKDLQHVRPIKAAKRIWIIIGEFGVIVLLGKIPLFFFKLEHSVAALYFVISVILIRLIPEISPLRNSFGKLVDDALLVNQKGELCSIQTVLIRHIIINLFLLPIYYVIYIDFDLALFNYFWFFFTVFIIVLNSIIYLKYSLFSHDFLTKTMVVWKVDYRKKNRI